MLELLILALLLGIPFRLLGRRHRRRQSRIAAAYDRARLVGTSSAGAGLASRRAYNTR